MTYLLWASPTLLVALAIILRGWSATRAALLGLALAAAVALLAAPLAFSLADLASAAGRGAWIGLCIAPYILGGLLFWRVAAAVPDAALEERPAPTQQSALERRRRLFFACFLIGPFAESATGFGVGMVGTVLMVRALCLAPRHLVIFALLSQTTIPWGAMGSGTLLAAAYVRVPATELALHAWVPMALLMPVWLALFWATLRRAGEHGAAAECVREAGWIALALAALAVATHYLGPETALLAAYSPLIVWRYLRDERPDRAALQAAVRRCLPYALMIGWLACTRLVPALNQALGSSLRLAPFDDLPALTPLSHSGLWFMLGAVLTAGLQKRTRQLPAEAHAAWLTGRNAVWTVLFFALMAEILAKSGIAQALAAGLFGALGANAVLLVPTVAGALGILTNSGNPGNSLFLPPLMSLAAQAQMSALAVAAVQHISGMSLGLFSPVRMSIASRLADGVAHERAVYRTILPYAAAALALLTLMAWVATRL